MSFVLPDIVGLLCKESQSENTRVEEDVEKDETYGAELPLLDPASKPEIKLE